METSSLPVTSMYFLILILCNFPLGSSAGLHSDIFRNQLHFGYGVNFKYNGQLYHNLDRVWVVHRVSLPQAKELDSLPNFPENLECYLSLREHDVPGSHHNLNRRQFIRQICDISNPNFKLLKKQAAYYRHQAHLLISEELHHALHGLTPIFETTYGKNKRALPDTEALLANASAPPLPQVLKLEKGECLLPYVTCCFMGSVWILDSISIGRCIKTQSSLANTVY